MSAPEEPRDLEDLLDAAGRSVQPTAFGWQTLPARLAQTPQKQPLTLQRWATLPLGVAAAATLFLVVWLGTSQRGGADPGPIEVHRQGLKLTILSVAETEGETLYMPFAPRPAAPQRERKRTGQALVRDRRLILNLRRGDNVVRFTDVAATIDPTSVRFESRTDPLGTRVVEQAFEYDLATADALLKRYLDRPVTCIGKDGEERSGHLASFDEQTIVLASAAPGVGKQRGTESVSRRGLRAVRLAEAPTDLVTRPTLVWKLRTQTPGRHETVLSYVCGFMKWQANYVVLITPGRGKQPDLLDVSGWVTIDNASGAAYPDAALRLIAGDVNRVRDPWAGQFSTLRDVDLIVTDQPTGSLMFGLDGKVRDTKKELVEKSFFEYHLYALTVPSSIRDRQIKQLNLLKRKGVKAWRRYVYDFAADSRHLMIELVAKNDKDNQLGLPLPKGGVAIEQRGADGETALLGRTEIDHTAVKEKLELRYQYAFDVVGEHRAVGIEYLWVDHWKTTYELRVRNHKAEAIEVRVFAHRLGRDSTLVEASAPHHRKDFETVYFDFTLPANAERVVRYTLETQE